VLQPVLSLWSRSLLSCFIVLFAAGLYRSAELADAPIPTAIFGVDTQDGFLTTNVVPLVPGTSYGWVMPMEADGEAVLWEEMLTLPAAPARWSNVAGFISDDRRTAYTRGLEMPFEGVVQHMWVVEAGDPPGEYQLLLLRNHVPVGSFNFIVQEVFNDDDCEFKGLLVE
jgi:hypothetical protein